MRAADQLLPGGLVARTLGRYEHRPSQLALADAVQQALEHEEVLLAEAPTGTGKTLAYLVPALAYAEETGRRVIVSTATRTLQDQMRDQDLLALGRLFSVPVATMKGLSNYLCLRRFNEFQGSAEASSEENLRALGQVRAWVDRSHWGERSELATLSDTAPLWSHITSSSETRIGQRCAYFEDCFVTNMRRSAEDARVVLVNHHLFFADLASRSTFPSAQILPDYDAVIFDEAHQIESTAALFFGVTLGASSFEGFVRDSERACAQARLVGAEPLCRTILTTAANFFDRLPAPDRDGSRQNLPAEVFVGVLGDAGLALDQSLEGLGAFARRHGDAHATLAQIARRATELRDRLAIVSAGSTPERVCFSERRGRRIGLGASPVDVSALLQEELFVRTKSVILTSATLSTDDNFAFVRSRLGIHADARELQLSSPFCYETQAALYCPQDLPDPRSEAYVSAAAKEIEALVAMTDGGAFVLCTSVRMQKALRDACHLHVPTLEQGLAPKATLLEQFRKLHNAVLFATASFWEGVDVPGSALRLVIIDKLPFEVPTDPLVAARCERLLLEGREPFSDYHVPAAALALKQGVGRLIRTRTDRGIVAVLDRRLLTMGYGKRFLQTLPPLRRCETVADLESFWRSRPLSETLWAGPGGPERAYLA